MKSLFEQPQFNEWLREETSEPAITEDSALEEQVAQVDKGQAPVPEEEIQLLEEI